MTQRISVLQYNTNLVVAVLIAFPARHIAPIHNSLMSTYMGKNRVCQTAPNAFSCYLVIVTSHSSLILSVKKNHTHLFYVDQVGALGQQLRRSSATYMSIHMQALLLTQWFYNNSMNNSNNHNNSSISNSTSMHVREMFIHTNC